MSDHDRAVFDTWLRDVILPTASVRDNNWGDAGTFARLAVSSHLGDGNAFDAAIARWRAMMDLVDADGHIPEEVRRGEDGITYTQEALQYKVGSAVLAARRGDRPLVLPGHGRRHAASDSIDYLASFADPTAHWPWDDRAEFPTPSPMWELVHSHWPDPRYIPLIDPVGRSATTVTPPSAGRRSPRRARWRATSMVRWPARRHRSRPRPPQRRRPHRSPRRPRRPPRRRPTDRRLSWAPRPSCSGRGDTGISGGCPCGSSGPALGRRTSDATSCAGATPVIGRNASWSEPVTGPATTRASRPTPTCRGGCACNRRVPARPTG